jgi:hypothetical protein
MLQLDMNRDEEYQLEKVKETKELQGEQVLYQTHLESRVARCISIECGLSKDTLHL